MMKNMITAMLAFAMLLTPAIVASADDTTASTEEVDFPEDTQINLSNYELPIEEMKALFPETVEVKSENGAYYVKDIGAAQADVFCYNSSERYDMTFVNGYWTVDLTEEELSGSILVTFYGEEFWQITYLDGIRENYLQVSTSGNVQYIGIYYSYDMVAMGYVTEDEKRIENDYKNGVLTNHKVRFDVEGSSFSYAYYDASKKLSYISVYTDNYYFLMEEGWSDNWSEYIACDAPAGFENYKLDDFNALVSHDFGCEHEWVAADCDTPKTCGECAKTKGEALGHSFGDATCESPKTCTVCGETEGEALGHSFGDATCEAPKTCTVCGETEGEALGHSFADATCESPKTCTVCGETEGEALGHSFGDATCEAPKTCIVCAETEGEALGHDFENGKCTVCEAEDPDYLPEEAPKDEDPTEPDTPEEPEKVEEPNWFVRIWNAILDFFRRLFGIEKRK